MEKRSRDKNRRGDGQYHIPILGPSSSDIIKYLADLKNITPNFSDFLLIAIERLEILGSELSLPFLSVYCYSLKSYVINNGQTLLAKLQNKKDITQTQIQNPNQMSNQFVQFCQNLVQNREPAFISSNHPNKYFFQKPDKIAAFPDFLPNPGRPPPIQNNSSIPQWMTPNHHLPQPSTQAKNTPKQAKVTPSRPVTEQSRQPQASIMTSSSSAAKGKIQFKETVIAEKVVAPDRNRAVKMPTTVEGAVKRSSSIYRFRRDEENEEDTKPKGVRFSECTPIQEEGARRKEGPARGRESSRNKSPMTRGRSQSVKHDKVSNVATVRQRNDPTPANNKFMMIRDLRETYDVHYITEADKFFDDAIREISKSSLIGFDAEYRMEKIKTQNFNAPSYLQFGLIDKCYVFNMNMLSQKKSALQCIWDICFSGLLLKVGHSVVNDLEKVFNYLRVKHEIKNKVMFHTIDISQCFFTLKPPQTLSLADLTHRYLGKSLRKNEKEISAGGKFDLTNELQMEYVALDALVPIYFYNKFKHLVNLKLDTTPLIDDENCDSYFVIDWGLWMIMKKPLKNKSFGVVKEMAKESHAQIAAYFIKNPTHVLISHDKGLLANQSIKNKIPFFNVEDTLAAMEFISEIGVASQDQSGEEEIWADVSRETSDGEYISSEENVPDEPVFRNNSGLQYPYYPNIIPASQWLTNHIERPRR